MFAALFNLRLSEGVSGLQFSGDFVSVRAGGEMSLKLDPMKFCCFELGKIMCSCRSELINVSPDVVDPVNEAKISAVTGQEVGGGSFR